MVQCRVGRSRIAITGAWSAYASPMAVSASSGNAPNLNVAAIRGPLIQAVQSGSETRCSKVVVEPVVAVMVPLGGDRRDSEASSSLSPEKRSLQRCARRSSHAWFSSDRRQSSHQASVVQTSACDLESYQEETRKPRVAPGPSGPQVPMGSSQPVSGTRRRESLSDPKVSVALARLGQWKQGRDEVAGKDTNIHTCITKNHKSKQSNSITT